jgi:hypothetical protein
MREVGVESLRPQAAPLYVAVDTKGAFDVSKHFFRMF